MECSHCKSRDPNIVLQDRVNGKSNTRLYCKRCQKFTTKFGAPKILLLDIEVSTGTYSLYSTGKQVVGWKSVKERGYMLGWAAKWLFDNKIHSAFINPSEAKRRDDKRISIELHKLMRDADLVIAHNGDKYDIRKINWFFALHNLEPNNRYQSIDTYKKAKQLWGAESCSLGYLLQSFGYNGKGHLHADDWDAVMAGDKQAIKYAEQYCRDDVYGLEDLYLKLRGWMRTHPNMSIYYEMYQPLKKDEKYCPRCLETIYEAKWTKQYRTPSGTVYKSCNCPHCGAVLRGQKL